MKITTTEELTSGARFFVGSNSSIKIKYHDASTPVDFDDAPALTRDDGLVAFDSELGTNREKCSVEPYEDGREDNIFFLSVETVTGA